MKQLPAGNVKLILIIYSIFAHEIKEDVERKKEDEQQEEEHMGRERGWPGTERSEVQEIGVGIEKHSLHFSVSKAD